MKMGYRHVWQITLVAKMVLSSENDSPIGKHPQGEISGNFQKILENPAFLGGAEKNFPEGICLPECKKYKTFSFRTTGQM